MKSSRFSLPTSASLFTSLIVGVCALGCVTEDADPVASTAGSGGSGAGGAPTGAAGTSPSTAGTNPGAGGAGGSPAAGDFRSNPAFGVATECPPVQQALITDFSAPGAVADAGADAAAPVTTGVTFGDFTTTFSGGTFTYPNAPGDPYAVNSDVSTGEWHLSGNVGNYSGFGLYFTGCNRIDVSEYLGISFTIRGSVAMDNNVTFSVGTSSNDISFLWLNAQPTPPNPLAAANSGRCIPAMNQYDGTCATPTFTVPVTATETTIEVLWADLAAGRPSASVDPSEITDIRWILPTPAGAGTTSPTPYPIDLFIDDLTFISP
jgi:hypothetical protein